ncbi:MAG TPA: GMC family oxidoreductase N-terminal domain-containing protein, partial [Xanthobacteraceae bacterium]
DRWAQKGALGWSASDVLPYFKRSEAWQGGDSDWRGGSGPVGVSYGETHDPLAEAWIAAGKAAGVPETLDYNGQEQVGFGRGQYSIRNGRRSSASTAYLRPARRRGNLTVLTRAHATRVLLQGTRAVGIEYVGRGSTVRVNSDREVILAAGAFNSPQLLMLSGIGPARHLAEMGIEPIVDLPVGKNLQDHPAVTLSWTRPNAGPFRDVMRVDRMIAGLVRAYLFGTGPATVIPGGLHAFIKTRPELTVPDIEFMFRSTPDRTHLWAPLVRPPYLDGFGIKPALLHPESRGEVLLRSADPRDAVRIILNLFSVRDDLETLREGIKRAREVAYQPPLEPFRGEELEPGRAITTDAGIDDWIRATAITALHPACSCAMGLQADQVLDPRLRVRGIEGLRVVDASAMPDLPSGHLNACVMMMAEKAADMIRGRPPSEA